jgi:acyl carrier protein
MTNVRDKVRTFIVDKFMYGRGDLLSDDSSFLEGNLIDSTGVLELIDFIALEFSIKVEIDELLPDNLDSINNIVAYIDRKLGSS